MSDTHLSVRVNPRLRKKLDQAAELTGRKQSELVRCAIEKECDEILETLPLSVTLKDYIGKYASEKPGNSGRVREVVTDILEEKRRQGRF